MKQLFLPYKLALIAKKKGYPQNTGANLGAWELKDGTEWFYTGAHPVGLLAAPLYQQIIDWFRETHKITIEVRFMYKNGRNGIYWQYDIHKIIIPLGVGDSSILSNGMLTNEEYSFYYDALNEAIKEAFKQI